MVIEICIGNPLSEFNKDFDIFDLSVLISIREIDFEEEELQVQFMESSRR